MGKKAPLLSRNTKKRFKPLSVLQFQDRFATEEDCVRFLFEKRWPEGWICPKCDNNRCYPIKERGLYECAACRYQASVTAGTILHKTHTSLRKWFLAVYFMTLDKRGISSVVLEKQLGISQKTAWLLLQKLRQAMGEREAKYKLEGFVELDECFFLSPREGGSRRRQKTKTRVLAGLSLTKEGKPLHIKFKVLPCNDRPHLEQAVESMVAPGATVVTNGLRSYLSLGGKGFLHERVLAGEAKASEKGPWLEVIVSNDKALIGGTYHGLDRMNGKHLQAYLDEYAYRFNRRSRPDLIFGRCITALVSCPIWTYRDIVGR